MRKAACLLAVAVFLLSAATPAHAWRHSRVFFSTSVFIGAPFFVGAPFFPVWGWGPWYPSYAPPAPVVIREAPQAYVQPPTVQAAPASYWYYCADAKAYYPYVQQCPGGWLKVVPQATPPGQY